MSRTPTDEEWEAIKRCAWDIWKSHGMPDAPPCRDAIDDVLQHVIGMYQMLPIDEQANDKRSAT